MMDIREAIEYMLKTGELTHEELERKVNEYSNKSTNKVDMDTLGTVTTLNLQNLDEVANMVLMLIMEIDLLKARVQELEGVELDA